MENRTRGAQWRRERELCDRARELRQWPTGAESVLWLHLRAKKLDGLHFRRQYPIGEFIVDFCCIRERFVVELEGDYHQEPQTKARDDWRQAKLESMGWRVVRFQNDETISDPGVVRERIRQAILGG